MDRGTNQALEEEKCQQVLLHRHVAKRYNSTMHKRFVNHCTIDLTLISDGPILIKSGKEGADPLSPIWNLSRHTMQEDVPSTYRKWT